MLIAEDCRESTVATMWTFSLLQLAFSAQGSASESTVAPPGIQQPPIAAGSTRDHLLVPWLPSCLRLSTLPAGVDMNTVVQVVYRDFNVDHHDFFRDVYSTVATTGMVASTLGADGKPACARELLWQVCGSSCQAPSTWQPTSQPPARPAPAAHIGRLNYCISSLLESS